jgi:hypothetical protein
MTTEISFKRYVDQFIGLYSPIYLANKQLTTGWVETDQNCKLLSLTPFKYGKLYFPLKNTMKLILTFVLTVPTYFCKLLLDNLLLVLVNGK